MTPAARISASIEVLTDIETRHRPAADALKDWGLSHRFAGSGDRAAIAGLAYDALRRKASAAFLMQDASARASVIGMLRLQRDLSPDQISALFDGARFAPARLSATEQHALAQASLAGAPPHVRGDYPEWLDPQLARMFGDSRAEEGAALAQRAPIDLRVNTLVAPREKVAAALAHLAVTSTPWSALGLRLTPGPDAKSPAIQSEPAFLKGMIEVQDEGSQIATLLTGAAPGEQVVDLCAGAGGKTLALAAMMENHGQIYATDLDKRRLAPIHARLERASARDVQIRTPRGGRDAPDPLADLHGRIDLVVIDAPCTGTGTWRRNPDAKWRVRPGALTQRLAEQVEVLDRAATLVKPGGRIGYITCSILAEEGPDQVAAFLTRHTEFRLEPAPIDQALGAASADFRTAVLSLDHGLLMTPRRTGTDGFFVSILRRAA
jgi:16S rRNA (cytosine967-C5)-methyltransferase